MTTYYKCFRCGSFDVDVEVSHWHNVNTWRDSGSEGHVFQDPHHCNNCCEATELEEVESDNPPDELLRLAIRRAV